MTRNIYPGDSRSLNRAETQAVSVLLLFPGLASFCLYVAMQKEI